jgi:hypothetical protein
LVIEDILSVAAFGRKVFEVTVLVDAMFLAELLPELAADWFIGSVSLVLSHSVWVPIQTGQAGHLLLLPH